MSSVIFYAGINLGNSSSAKSQINKDLWINACFRFDESIRLNSQSDNDYFNEEGNAGFPYQNSFFQADSIISPADSLLMEGSNLSITPPINQADSIISPVDSILIDDPDSTKLFIEDPEGDTIKVDDSDIDTTFSLQDTVVVDSAALDSTARIKYFRYNREDRPYVRLKSDRMSSFFAQPGTNLKTRTTKIDSTGKYVEIKETVAGQETKVLLRLPVEEYINLRLSLREREIWEEAGYAYELKDTKRGLGDLISDITDFEIPLPSVGVLSIFGEPKISLKIGGAVDIHGAWRSETTEGVTASRLGNTRNEPDFKQQVQINVNGTIGDKLNISADWNTERTFEYENQLKLVYTGYEDEIIQSIEAGNVSLQTSPLVGGSEALFGIKSKFMIGPFSLTTIASQKKGEIKEVSVSGGTTSQEFAIRAYDYSTNHYFLDSTYADGERFNNYYGQATPNWDQSTYIVDIEVWKSLKTVGRDVSKEREANVFIDLPFRFEGDQYDSTYRGVGVSPVPGRIEQGRFILLTPEVDYTINREVGFISFNTSINDEDVIAVAYRTENTPGPSDDYFYGDFINQTNPADTARRLVLKLVKPQGLQSQYTSAWRLQLKNIYPVGGRNIKEEGFEFNVKYEIEGQEPVSDMNGVRLLTAFGLDVTGPSNTGGPDNLFDFRPRLTVLPVTGEIIFPTLEPFGEDLPEALPDSIAYNAVYDTIKTFAKNVKVKDKWILTGKYSGEASSVYQLGFNIVENSVRVLLNGRELSPGTDYTVDYNIGQLTIRNDAALVPGADLKVTYEQNDLFQLASKTLLGARGLYQFSPKTSLGFSVLNLNQQTLSDKVRIGEEPLSNTIYGADFTTLHDLPFLTKLLDNVISTREMSTFSLTGEYAYINPDPNTKKSTIQSDEGKSIAYIDDFEGAKRIIPVGISYTSWKDLSPPDELTRLPGLTPLQRMNYKAKSFWFTATPSDVNVKDIWPLRDVGKADQQVTVMDYVYLPMDRGTFNYDPDIDTDHSRNWGGIMKSLSSTASNLIEENIEFIELWINVQKAPPESRFYIDLGRISEDVIPNGVLDTEDKDFNDAIDDAGLEDTGLDGINDDQERSSYPDLGPDPSGDNFSFTTSSARSLADYYNINGTEGNVVLTDIGRFPDTEDLNRNGQVDLVNSYYRYEIPLDTNRSSNPFIAGGGDNAGWYLYRIPLKDTLIKIGDPSFTNVEFIRFFVTGAADTMWLRMTEFNLVGSQWEKLIREDTVLTVSVINQEDNPGYTSPPGVFRERDRSQPDEEIYRNEQALNLIINDLPAGQSREAVKYLFRPLDVFNYSEMKLFIHGDESRFPGSISYREGENYSAEVYFRFGGDSNNYYEYRQPVDSGWNEVRIIFSELTAIKQQRDSITAITKVPVAGMPGHFYQVKGNPSLTGIKFLTVGIKNVRETIGGIKNLFGISVEEPISGEVWVNELRVVGADDTPGWAYSFGTNLKMADLLTVNFNMSKTDPNFHKLADRFGSRIESSNWSASADLDVLKALPVSMPESNLRLNYSHSESVGKPVYIPGTDIRVEDAARLSTTKSPEDIRTESQTVNITDTWTASNIKLKIPSNYWLVRDSWNALTFGFNYNKTFSRSPSVLVNQSWLWNATVNYGINFSPDYYFYPQQIPVLGAPVLLLTDYKNVKVFYAPQNFAMNLSAKRNRNTNINRPQINSPSQEVVSRDFTTTRGFNFAWKITEGGFLNLTTNYTASINSSLAHLELDQFERQRKESDIWKDIYTGVFFGKDNQFQQNFELRTAPKLPTLWDINRFFSITTGYSVGYQWNFDFRQPELGRSAGFSSKFNAGLVLRLKSLATPLFAEEKTTPSPNVQQPGDNQGRRGRGREQEDGGLPLDPKIKSDTTLTDTTMASDTTAIVEGSRKSPLKNALLFLKNTARVIFFDYETISFNFTNDNSVSKSGLFSEGTGFKNFWGFSQQDKNGPPRLFMFGLDSDVGLRAPSANLQDVFSQKNNLDFKTSRPLWEGAKIDLNWKVGWSLNKSTTLNTDENGVVSVLNRTSTGTINRSFLSLPPTLFLSVFSTGIKQVAENYDPAAPNQSLNLSDAFLKGFETFPILSNLGFLQDVAKYIPRPNWRLTWDGLEKFFLFEKFAEKVSLDHAYNSNYTEGWKINPEGNQEIQTQKVEYAFAPLAGLNFSFGELWGGNLTSNLKYSTRTNYDLGISTKNITETFSKEIGITAGYAKSGFEIPLFGLSLQNDIEFSFSYTSANNSTVIFNMNQFIESGTPQDGTTRVTMEPRIKYTISSKVTLSIFFKRSTVEPEGAARIPPTTTNEAGLDVRISIQ